MEQTYAAKVEQISWQDEPAVRFCAGGYEALLIPGVGANVIRLYDMIRGLDLLRTPTDIETFKARPQVYGIPVLFPPNRIQDGTFVAAGKTYNFPINTTNNNHSHGFLRTRPWKVTRTETISDNSAEVEVTFYAGSTTDFFEFLPHEFVCKIVYNLSNVGLKQTFSITNNSSTLMPMGLGYHTSFNVPFHPDSKDEDYLLKISIHERWLLNNRMLPTGELAPLSETEMKCRNTGMPPFQEPFDNHYSALPIMIDGMEFHGAIIEDTSKNLQLVYEVGKDFKHWMVYNAGGNNGFIGPEPQTWVVNAPNINLPDEVTGMKLLAPGETWEESCRIYVKEI